MGDRFRIGDHVAWNSEAGRVSGVIIAVHTQDFDYKGHTHHATARVRLVPDAFRTIDVPACMAHAAAAGLFIRNPD